MGRDLSQMVRQELNNLNRDSESRISAMKALKSLIKDLDPNSIPIIVSQVSNTEEIGLTWVEFSEFAVSVYEDIARVHGPLIVPHIDNIMSAIVNALASSSNSGSFGVHLACSKAVSAIARYGVGPTTPDDRKQQVMHSLCRPLSDSVLARDEGLSSGAARCLKALVELDDWRFCSSQTVNEVCQRVAAGLEREMESVAHMGLVMALAKRNGLVVEGYARLLVRAGVRMLNTGVTEGDSRKRLSAIRMVNCLIMSLDVKCIISELSFVIEEFRKLEHDEMADVNEAALEGIRMAKRILWSNVNVSLKDGLFSGQVSTPSSAVENSEAREDHEDGFSGFLLRSPINGDPRSQTPSPQRTRLYVNADNISHFTTPRKLGKPLHVPDDGCSNNQSRRFRSPSSSKFNRRSNSNYNENGFNECFTNKDEQMVSATEDIPTNGSYHVEECQEPVPETQVKSRVLSAVSIYSGLFVLLVAVVWYLWVRGIDEGYNLVPT